MIVAKVILVVGGTSGIGQECAQRLAQAHKVFAAGRRVDLEQEDKRGDIRWLRCDVTDQESVEQCVSRVLEQEGRIDVLIYCAGFALGGGVEDTSVEEARDQFETNFFGAHRVIRQVMPVMRKQGDGAIIVISSVASEFTIPFQSFYSTSKMALDGLVQAVRMEGTPFGIKAACVNPGDVQSGFTAARKQAAGYNENSPYFLMTKSSIESMKRDETMGMNPESVARLVVRLVEAKQLKPKYFVELKYKAVMVLKRILPVSIVEKLLVSMYVR
jgi:NAD(P)-dependent dehydrogenase (short-subunit alcohol dehydrogenase family)